MYSPRSVSTGLTPGRLEGVVQLDLLRGHRLALHGHPDALVAAEAEDDVARLVPGRRPVDVAAQPLDVVRQPLEVAVELLERRLLDGARPVAERLALRESPRRTPCGAR